MGLFDKILGGVIGAGANGGPQQIHRTAGRLAKRRQSIREEWLSAIHEVMDFAGTELPITADQIHQVLGSDTVKNLAAKMGLPADKIAELLAQHLPQGHRQGDPDGKLPDNAVNVDGHLTRVFQFVSTPPPASGGRSRVAHLEAGPHLQSPTESEVNVAGNYSL